MNTGFFSQQRAPGKADEPAEQPVQILVFSVGEMQLGVDIEQVSYLVRMVEITPVPEARPHVEGVIDLRGQVVPIISLNRLFGQACATSPLDMHILIGSIGGRHIGLTVESVSDLYHVSPEHLQPAEQTSGAASLFRSVARVDNGIVFVLDLNKIVELQGTVDWGAAAESAAPSSASPEVRAALRQRTAVLREAGTEEEVLFKGFLIIGLGNEKYAIERSEVEKIVVVTDIASVPGTAEHFAGLTNFAGDICWVVDLKKLLGLRPTLPGNEERIVVLNYNGARFGFLADTVFDVANIPASAVRPAVTASERTEGSFVSEEIYWQDELIGVLDLSKLCQN
ncbi:MAG: purine-binding chemotaxis protein CheW [Planctomycetes bacterium]|nr:purine-binding chemotaxis protein CheW [Planctomycetota bacterium]